MIGGVRIDSGLTSAIDSLNLEGDETPILLDRLAGRTQGLLLYGSRARGDHVASSDVDLLNLSPHPMSTFKAGRVSVSSYTDAQLHSATGTLFGTHLIRDGKLVYDPDNRLGDILASLKPADPAELIASVRRYSVVLNQAPVDKEQYFRGLVRLARYLLRTAIYAKAMLEGRPCFSVRELAQRFGDTELAVLLASDPAVTGPASIELLDDLTGRLEAVVGPLPPNTYGSLAALAVGAWEVDHNVAALAIRAGSEDVDTQDYSDLPKVLL